MEEIEVEVKKVVMEIVKPIKVEREVYQPVDSPRSEPDSEPGKKRKAGVTIDQVYDIVGRVSNSYREPLDTL